ncbi:hypothetical protein [Actinoallomurus acaciae]|uniref:Uncharacterized protein n=1 Tax=Actinoallomurus acaciae TaxID=502577 RepID=A0ABV5YE81_9ACTN
MAFRSEPADGLARSRRRLAFAGGLGRFLRHTSSALFAVPRGCDPTGHLGQDLVERL